VCVCDQHNATRFGRNVELKQHISGLSQLDYIVRTLFTHSGLFYVPRVWMLILFDIELSHLTCESATERQDVSCVRG